MLSAGSLRTMKTTVLARCMEDFGQENVFLGSKTVVLVHYCMVHNAYHTKLNLNFIITRKNDANVAKIANTCLTKKFMATRGEQWSFFGSNVIRWFFPARTIGINGFLMVLLPFDHHY